MIFFKVLHKVLFWRCSLESPHRFFYPQLKPLWRNNKSDPKTSSNTTTPVLLAKAGKSVKSIYPSDEWVIMGDNENDEGFKLRVKDIIKNLPIVSQ